MGVLQGKRVLVTEDEPLIRLCVAIEIEDAGGEAIEAAAGDEALAIIMEDLAIDALVTDVRMPRMDGWTLAERARELRPGLPVIYVTGWSDVPPRPVFGGQVLLKPCGLRVIPATVAALLSGANT